ncbi:FkbM family methyltransferase [Alphaproteobacteria bacterium]|nr:FkbM family methyltransferase [Alphaproteobacteria bacterium]MDA9590760.1 FkbM family methyltransferase [Alphaproteobacteria bacterium]MDB2430993.1 FkbM family methyltransferase [Alphaproteobacteria bacterium]
MSMYQKFSRTRIFRNFLFRLLRKEKLPIVSRELDDHIICFSPSGVIGRHLMTKGHWHREHVDIVIGLLKQHDIEIVGKIACDIGANIGTQTIYLHKVEVFSKILAIEPDPNNFKLLSFNIEINNLGTRTSLINAAISRTPGIMPLYLNPGFTDGGHSLLKKEGLSEQVDVRVIRMKTAFNEAEINPKDIGFCWIDTEGFDLECVSQILETAGNKVPVFTEVSEKFKGKEEADSYINYLNEHYQYAYTFENNGTITFSKNNNAEMIGPSVDILAFNIQN